MNDLAHAEIVELLGAYALDAVEPEEAALVGRHLHECASCAAELEAMREVVGLIANSGGDARPELWESISTGLERPPPSGDWQGPRGLLAPGEEGPVTRSRRRPSHRVSAKALAIGAVAAALVLIAALGVQVGRLTHRVHQLQTTSVEQAIAHAADSALSDPRARRITLDAPQSSRPAVAEIAVLPSGAAFLVNRSLPQLAGDQTYQLWGQEGEALVSLGLLGHDPGAVAFHVDPGVTITAFAVTAEQAGGVVRTTHVPVAVSGVSA